MGIEIVKITYTQDDYKKINFVNTPERYKFYFRRSGEDIEDYLIYLLNQIFCFSKIKKAIVIENNIEIKIRDLYAPLSKDDFFEYWGDEIVFFFNNDDIILKYNIDDDFFIIGVKDTVERNFFLDIKQIGFLPISEFVALENYFLIEEDKEKMFYLYGTVPHKYYEKKATTLSQITKGIVAILSVIFTLLIMTSLPFLDKNESEVSFIEILLMMGIFLLIFGFLYFIAKIIKHKYFQKKK